MLFAYIVCSVYTLLLGIYWLHYFASLQPEDQFQIDGNLFSLVYLALMLLMVVVSLGYFAYLHWVNKLNKKQIMSKVMSHHKSWFLGVIVVDSVVGIGLYTITIVEEIIDQMDCIKIHGLFITLIIFVAAFRGLCWFGISRTSEILIYVVFVLVTFSMVFLDCYFDEFPSYKNYTSGSLIIAYELMYIILHHDRNTIKRVFVKLLQYGSFGWYIKRTYELLVHTSFEDFSSFSFQMIWMILMILVSLTILAKDFYELVVWIKNVIHERKARKYVCKFRLVMSKYLLSKLVASNNESMASLEPQQPQVCSICLDSQKLEAVVRLDCSHMFHHECLFMWFNKGTTCPTCREYTDISALIKLEEVSP